MEHFRRLLFKLVVILASVFASRAAFDAGAPAVAVILAGLGGYLTGFWDGAEHGHKEAPEH